MTGAAGIGKTSLVAAVEQRARRARARVLRVAGAEHERGLAFGGAERLLQPALRAEAREERSRLLRGAAGIGGQVVGFGAPAPAGVAGGADRRFAAFHGLYWLCANLAERAPLAMLVDDAHWLDAESLAWLEYVARRLDGLPLLIVAATRPDEAAGRRLARVAVDAGGAVLELRPLSDDAVRALLEAGLGRPAEAEFAVAFRRSTGGNPFLVHELLRTIEEGGIAPDASGVPAILTLGSGRIARAVLLRLSRLSAASVELARAIAILGRAGSLSVAARLAGLDDAEAARAAEALVGADLLANEPELAFHHPVVRASVYEDLPAPVRALRHRQAARLLAEIGAPAAEVASQLIEAEPAGDAWAVGVLRAAARDAFSRGATGIAIVLLERALIERRGRDDPGLLMDLGRAELAALAIPEAVDALARARARAGPAVRPVVTLQLARVLLHAGRAREAVGLLTAELETATGVDAEVRTWLEVECVLHAERRLDTLAATRRFRALEGRTVAELAALAAASSMAETAREASALARRALAGGVLVRALDAATTWFLAPWMLIRADRLEDAAAVVDESLDLSRAAGSQAGFARSSWLRAEVDHRRGDLLSAEGHARAAHAIAAEGGSLWLGLMSGSLLAQVLADRGDLARSQAVLDGLDLSTLPPEERLTRTVHYARAHTALLAGRPEQAIEELARLLDDMRATPAWRARFATGMAPYATALARAGRTPEARRAARAELAWARSWGSPRFVGLALRARAQAETGGAAIRTLRAAVAALETAPASLELALALRDLGTALRRGNQRSAARDPLRRGLDLARRCRADALAEHLHGELRAAGARPRREALTGRDALTASEARIARMAALGLTNAQIAQAIFLTPGTVEKHLTSVYAKLGITSRQRLPAALDDGSAGPP